MHPLVEDLQAGLAGAADPEKARPMQAYMKTDQPFYGVQSGLRRTLFKEAVHRHEVSSRTEYEEIVLTLWEGVYREEMYQALEVAEHFKRFRDADAWPLFEHLVHTADWWDTLDWIAGKLVSPLVLKHRKFEARLVEWARSDHLWTRRASLLAHLHHKNRLNKDLLASTILQLAGEREFFIRKAIGWILRDYSYANPDWVEAFVSEHASELSALSRREALKQIERMRAERS